MQELILKIKDKKTLARLKVQTTALKAIHEYMVLHGVTQLMPVLLSPVTDPLCHTVYDASIKYLNQELKLTKSMLLHKQAAMIIEDLDSLYIMSPNVRLEKPECKKSGRHLIEFTQVDIELKKASKHDFMSFIEGLVIHVIKTVKKECKEELFILGRKLKVPKRPFKTYESESLREEYGEEYEKHLSSSAKKPFWILNLKREFYDREDPERKGYYHNYDLFWPEGYGEALSGGERDWEYAVLLRKLKERGQREEDFATYMELARRGLLVPTAGGGLGVERLVRFLTGAKHIQEVVLFPRTPGERILL